MKSILLKSLLLLVCMLISSCDIDVIVDSSNGNGLISGIHQIADGVIDIIEYFD